MGLIRPPSTIEVALFSRRYNRAVEVRAAIGRWPETRHCDRQIDCQPIGDAGPEYWRAAGSMRP